MAARQTNIEGWLGVTNVLDKGMIGNGVTDDAPTLTSILSVAGSGQMVVVPPPPGSSYLLKSSVTVPANGALWLLPGVVLSGAGTLTAAAGGLLFDLRAGTFVVSGIAPTFSSGISAALTTITGHVLTTGTAPTAAAGANAGTTPPAPVVAASSNDVRGSLTFGTGTTPAAGDQVDVTFATAFGAAPFVMVIAQNTATQALGLYVPVASTTGFSIRCSTAPAASQANTVYAVSWLVVG